jgi:hypothetical protein
MSPALLTSGSSTQLNGNFMASNGHISAPAKPVSGFGTRAIHVGSEANAETGAVIPPISLSTTYKQDGVGNHKVGPTLSDYVLVSSFPRVLSILVPETPTVMRSRRR